jgi:hypothetical protein
MDSSRYLTIKQVAARYPAFSEQSLRWLVFNAATNGMAGVVIRIGRRVLIDTKAFQEWIERHRQGGAA